jgi:hypothetical protein
MRKLARALGAVAMLACSGNNPARQDMGGDMSLLGCLGILTCASSCTSDTCAQTCITRGTQGGQLLYRNLGICVENTCPSDAPDGGTSYCGPRSDPSCCDWCYTNAQSGPMSMLGICRRAPSAPPPCVGQQPTDSDGICGACAGRYNDCVADTP